MDSEGLRPDVVAGKYDPNAFDPKGKVLLVNDVFHTVQGEGLNAGRAAVFVRFAKCNLACRFCDTEFEAHTAIPVEELARKIEVMGPVQDTLVVLTGGEPGLQNLGPLLDLLRAREQRAALETSGSVYAHWMFEPYLHVCVSPKVKKHMIPTDLLLAADEVKWIVNDTFLRQLAADPNGVYVGRDDVGGHPPVNFLQPESQNPKFTEAAVKLVMSMPHRYRLSIQTHKYIGVK